MKYEYAHRGWAVFPIVPGQKKPLLTAWQEKSTTDFMQIAAWEKEFPGCNWAMDCGKSNVAAVDIDPKGKNYEPPAKSGWVVITPRGGRHIYYKGDLPNTTSKITLGVDTRGSGGYVLIPGSRTEHGEYSLTASGELAPVPRLFGGTGNHKPAELVAPVGLDREEDIARAEKWLLDRDGAVEGNGGDAWTYQTACHLKDLGLSENMTLILMWEQWNRWCQPPWAYEDLKKKVVGAFKYGQNPPGVESLQNIFPAPPEPKQKAFFRSVYEVANSQVKIDWVVPGYLERGTIGVVFGEFQAFKSFLLQDLCLAKAMGLEWAGKKLKPGAVAYIAGEGGGGLNRRVRALCIKRGVTLQENTPLFFSTGAVSLSEETAYASILSLLKPLPPLELIVIDTLAANFGGGDENSTKDIGRVLYNVAKIQAEKESTIAIVHHTGHQSKDRSRGASALEAGVDFVYQVSRDGKELACCLRSPRKMKDGAPPEDTWFRLEEMVLGVDEDLQKISTLVVDWDKNYTPTVSEKSLGSSQDFILGAIKDGKTDVKELHTAYKEWKGEKYIRSAFYRTLINLQEKGLIP